jgi:hypothetical protein
MNMVKRILDRNFKEIAARLQDLYDLYRVECQKEDNFIIDLLATKDASFDYLSFLSLFSDTFCRGEIKRQPI